MRTRSLLSTALYAATALAVTVVAVGDEPAPTGDLAKLQGRWTALFGPQKNIPMVVTVRGTGVTLAITTPDGQEHESKGEIKIDENAKPNKTIDWIKFTKPGGEAAPDNLGIYKLNGDSITFCNGGPGNERPTEFRAGEGGMPQLIVLNRRTASTATATPTAAGDQAKLEGRWTGKAGPKKNIPMVMTIKGSSVAFKFTRPDGRERESKGEIKIDENAKPHKRLDWINFTNQGGEKLPERLAIYTLDGDTLTICSGGAGDERPTEFLAGEGGKPSLIVLSRERE